MGGLTRVARRALRSLRLHGARGFALYNGQRVLSALSGRKLGFYTPPLLLLPSIDPTYFPRQLVFVRSLIQRVEAGESVDAVLTGFDASAFGERVVEYPYWADWFAHRGAKARVLDVGCVLNNEISASSLRTAGELWYCNPAREPLVRHPRPVSYHVSALQDAFRDGDVFDCVTCLSTIEHIGYDNSQYGSSEPARFTEPNDSVLLESVSKLASLVAPGGSLLVSVPFGFREVLVHPVTKKRSSQVFDAKSLRAAVAALDESGLSSNYVVFEASTQGWSRVASGQSDARYGQRTPGAGAVALLHAERPGSDQVVPE